MAIIHEVMIPKIIFRDFSVNEKESKVKNRPMPRSSLGHARDNQSNLFIAQKAKCHVKMVKLNATFMTGRSVLSKD